MPWVISAQVWVNGRGQTVELAGYARREVELLGAVVRHSGEQKLGVWV